MGFSRKILLFSIVAASLLPVCNSATDSGDRNEPSKVTLLSIMAGEIPPWTETQEGISRFPEDNAIENTIDGGAVPYQKHGMKNGFFQNLEVTGTDKYAAVMAMDFGTAAKATAMYKDEKADTAKFDVNFIKPVEDIDSSVAFLNTSTNGGCVVYSHFQRYYIEIEFTGYEDPSQSYSDAKKFVNMIKNKANNI